MESRRQQVRQLSWPLQPSQYGLASINLNGFGAANATNLSLIYRRFVSDLLVTWFPGNVVRYALSHPFDVRLFCLAALNSQTF